MLRLCNLCSTTPTHRNSRHLATAWKIISNTPAQTASLVPMPPHITTNPRLATVDYASTRLASDVVIAASEPIRKVTPPTNATIRPTVVPVMTGARRKTR